MDPDRLPPGLSGAAPFAALFSRCVVRVACGGTFRGSGFFVTPTEVLTCAHVIHGSSALTVEWDGGRSAAVIAAKLPPLANGDPRERFFPFPDVALLRVTDPPDGQPCALLEPGMPAQGPPADVLGLAAWTADEYAPDSVVLTSATFEYEGPLLPDGGYLLKLKNGQVAHGFSGGPLLNIRTGGVCGLVDSTRDSRSALGGFGVPLSGFLGLLPGLLSRNHEHHGLPLVRPLLEVRREVAGSGADLLHPRYGVVPFLGRDDLLARLMLWREHPDPLRVVVLAGAGGFGKTRTAVEVCVAAERAGWTVGFLALADDRQLDRVAALAGWPGRLLVAIDYAETRPGTVAELLLSLHRRPGALPARVILITRQVGTKDALRELFATGDGMQELAGLVRDADLVRLDRDVDEVSRSDLFDVATRALTARLGRPPQQVHRPALEAGHFGRPLYVLAAALLMTEDSTFHVDDLAADDILAAVLDRHEAEYWDRWNRRLGLGLSRPDQGRAVAWAALLGAETEAEALALVRQLPGLADGSDERVRAVARWLSSLYGSGRLDGRPAVIPLEPDLLAEALIAGELTADDPG
ncbi:MAG TPA: serine protease [Streptosporangiaceae bacterium]|nr:serine protease [Streptosporangiaceae bacterium]